MLLKNRYKSKALITYADATTTSVVGSRG